MSKWNEWKPNRNAKHLRAYIPLSEFEKRLKDLQQKSGKFINYRVGGLSVGKRPIYVVTLTDESIPEEEKEKVLLVAGEHGEERSGVDSLWETIEWLLKPEVSFVLKKEKVIIIPCLNPDGYEELAFTNMNGVNLFADYNFSTGPTQPESKLLAQIMDDEMPDAFMSLHGTWLSDEFHMLENSSCCQTNQYERPYNRDILEEVNASAESAGFPMDRGEDDSQRILPRLPGFEYQSFQTSEGGMTSGIWAYHLYHTLSIVLEVQCKHSGFLRVKRFLEIGTSRYPTEDIWGYPNRTLKKLGHFFIIANGKNRYHLRKNRMRHWQDNQNYVIASTREYQKKVVLAYSALREDYEKWVDISTFGEFKNYLGYHKKTQLKSQIPDDIEFFCYHELGGYNTVRGEKDLVTDIAFRFRMPIGSIIKQIFVNGTLCRKSQYSCWQDKRWTYIQFLPAALVGREKKCFVAEIVYS